MLEKVFPPVCTTCGGTLKTEVVFFVGMLSREVLDEAFEESGKCDIMIAIGSSLVVYPAAQIPSIAKSNGARLIIVNFEPTPYDRIADFVFHGKAGDILPEILPGQEIDL
jgi:NAD-dependent deacetylase